MKKLLPTLFGLILLVGCAAYIEPAPYYNGPSPVIYYGPYYGPQWNEYYWHPHNHYYCR